MIITLTITAFLIFAITFALGISDTKSSLDEGHKIIIDFDYYYNLGKLVAVFKYKNNYLSFLGMYELEKDNKLLPFRYYCVEILTESILPLNKEDVFMSLSDFEASHPNAPAIVHELPLNTVCTIAKNPKSIEENLWRK